MTERTEDALPAIVPEDTLPTSRTPDSLIEVYLRTLTSPQTKKTYNTELRMFMSFIEGEIRKDISEVTAEDVGIYRDRLLGGYSASTVAKKLTAMRRFLTFTYMAGITRVNPEALKFFAKSPRVRHDPAYNILTDDELSRMMNAARRENYRDYVMLAVMASCGLREAELIGTRVGDFKVDGTDSDGEDVVFLRITGKGDKVRNVPVSPDLWRLVQNYVIATGRSFASNTDARRPLLESREGKHKPLTTRSIRYIVKKYVKKAGINKAISPHSIRHTVGTNMAVNEAPLLIIQQFLGHEDPKTTMRYIRRAEDIASKAYRYNTLKID